MVKNLKLKMPYFGRIVTVNFNEEYKVVTVGVALYREPTTIYQKTFEADTHIYSELFSFAAYVGIVDYDTNKIDLSKLINEKVVVILEKDIATGNYVVSKIDLHKKCYDDVEYFKEKFKLQDNEVDEFFYCCHGENDSSNSFNEEIKKNNQPRFKLECILDKSKEYEKFCETMSTYSENWFADRESDLDVRLDIIRIEKVVKYWMSIIH